jgi:hypothetical protein
MEEERPRFRRDLDARPVEVDGISYVEATDPRSGNVFRFYDFEHAVAEALDGRALHELLPEVRQRSGFPLTTEQLAQFSEKLRELGFLEVGDDDATSAGPAPAGVLDSGPTQPETAELDAALAAAAIPPGSTEKLPVLGATDRVVPIGSTEKLPTLEQPAFKEPPVEEPPPKQPADKEPPPAGKQPPVEEPPAGKPPVEEPPPEDPALSPRAGELRSDTANTGELELAPPPVAAVVAPELDEEEAALAALPGSDEPTKSERRDDLISASADRKAEAKNEPHKGTLFGVPFQKVEQVLGGARAGTEKTPPPVTPIGPQPRPQAEAKAVAGPAVAGPVPASPFPLASTQLQVAPFPPAATPPPQPALRQARTTADIAPLTKTAEVVPLAKTAEVVPVGDEDGHPQGKSDVVPTLGPSIEVPALVASAEVPALAPGTPRPSGRGRSPLVFAAAGVVLAGALGALGFLSYRSISTSEQGPVAVRTILPTPGTTYRWFDATGTIKNAGERTLTFTTGGKVVKVASPGTSFHPGDVIAEVEGAPQFKQAVEHNKQRLAYYENRLEQMTRANNRPEIHQAELKIAEKKKLIADAQAGLSRQGVVATGAGEIAEAVVTPGTVVKAGAPAVRVKGSDWRAEFELSRDDANAVRRLGFCRVEIAGKPFECSLSAEGGDETHVLLDLPSEPEMAAGKSVRLARARYDAAFVLPATALVPSKGSDRRVFVVKDGRAESYAVVLADQTPTEIVVTQGLEPGSAVVAEVPPSLKPRTPVKATPK